MEIFKIDGLGFFIDLKKIRVKKKITLLDLSIQCKIPYELLVDLESGRHSAMNLLNLSLYCKALGINKIVINNNTFNNREYWRKFYEKRKEI